MAGTANFDRCAWRLDMFKVVPFLAEDRGPSYSKTLQNQRPAASYLISLVSKKSPSCSAVASLKPLFLLIAVNSREFHAVRETQRGKEKISC